MAWAVRRPVVALASWIVLVIALGVAAPLESFHINWSWPFALSMLYLVIGNSIIAMTLLLAYADLVTPIKLG